MSREPLHDYPAEAMARLRDGVKCQKFIADNVRHALWADVAALLDYAERAGEAMRWRPIESASKDGTPVIVFVDCDKSKWKRAIVLYDDGWRFSISGTPSYLHCKPTHWLPLPPAPDREG